MAIIYKDKVYRNLQEQVKKNMEDIDEFKGSLEVVESDIDSLQNKHIHIISIYSEAYKYSIQFIVRSTKATAFEDLTEIYQDLGNATIPAAGLCSMGILNEKVHSLSFDANGVTANEIAMDGSDSGETSIQSDELIDYVI